MPKQTLRSKVRELKGKEIVVMRYDQGGDFYIQEPDGQIPWVDVITEVGEDYFEIVRKKHSLHKSVPDENITCALSGLKNIFGKPEEYGDHKKEEA